MVKEVIKQLIDKYDYENHTSMDVAYMVSRTIGVVVVVYDTLDPILEDERITRVISPAPTPQEFVNMFLDEIEKRYGKLNQDLDVSARDINRTLYYNEKIAVDIEMYPNSVDIRLGVGW